MRFNALPSTRPVVLGLLVAATFASHPASSQLAPQQCTLTQITSASDASDEPSISYSGDRIAFESSANLTGQNADGFSDIFLRTLSTLQTVQVVDSPTSDSDSVVVSGNGARIAFISNEDLLGTNADHDYEVFVRDCAVADQPVTEVPALGPVGALLLVLSLGAAAWFVLRTTAG